MLPTIPRTSLDLELDLQAQHSKLETLNDEIKKLKELKQRYSFREFVNYDLDLINFNVNIDWNKQ